MQKETIFRFFCFCFTIFLAYLRQAEGFHANATANTSASLLNLLTDHRNHLQTQQDEEGSSQEIEYPGDDGTFGLFLRKRNYNFGKSRNTVIASRTQYFLRKLGCKVSTNRYRCAVCEKIKKMARKNSFSQMRFYLAEPKPNTVYTVTLPEGEIEPPTISPHAIAVVDPFIKADFGHVVVAFYVYDIDSDRCEEVRGLYSEPNICLKLIRRRNCVELFASSSICGDCEVNFLPIVYNENPEEAERKQLLECQNLISGYGRCPKDLVLPYEMQIDCKSDRNLYNCPQPKVEVPPRMPEVCNDFSVCDYAIELFGGWNRIVEKSMQLRQQTNMEKMTDMLLRNGFDHDKIQIFYHNYSKVLDFSPFNRSLPATNKSFILTYINGICHSKNGFTCVDSLVIYLNSPTLSHGSMLLWDNDENGRPDRNERLEIDELLETLTDCNARRVFLFVDQRYSGLYKKNLEYRKAQNKKLRKKILLVTNSRTLEKFRSEPATRKWSRLQPDQLVASLAPPGRHLDRHGPENFTIYGTSQEQLRRGSPETFMGCMAVKNQKVSFNSISVK